GAVASIIEGRTKGGAFKDLFDLAARVDSRQLNRRVFEALIRSGALDGLPGNRAQKLAALDTALDLAARSFRDAALGQTSLFAEATQPAALTPRLPDVPAPSHREMLSWERETLGIFISGHPLSEIAPSLARSGAVPLRDLRALADDTAVTIAGAVTGVRRTVTKSGQQLLVAQLEDMTGACDVVLFSRAYADFQQLFDNDAILVVKGRLRFRERPGAKAGDEPRIELSVAANEVQPFVAQARSNNVGARGWHVEVTEREQIDRLARLIDQWPGDVPIVMHVAGRCQRVARAIAADARVRGELERIFAPKGVREELA
ncbi:MAG: hypothetical protein JO263_08855, partial [Candidatus Eremiobacteraeota bacterium]|nr:hypothetical protein [Candidatus Eremiobacteraeota bacterium]